MSVRSLFRFSGWLGGSVFILLLTNFFLILFVSGADIFLGQPPQFTLPLFSLIAVSLVLIAVHRSSNRAVDVASDDGATTRSAGLRHRRPRAVSQEPLYLSMTVIRRPLVQASSSVREEWRGTIQ